MMQFSEHVPPVLNILYKWLYNNITIPFESLIKMASQHSIPSALLLAFCLVIVIFLYFLTRAWGRVRSYYIVKTSLKFKVFKFLPCCLLGAGNYRHVLCFLLVTWIPAEGNHIPSGPVFSQLCQKISIEELPYYRCIREFFKGFSLFIIREWW